MTSLLMVYAVLTGALLTVLTVLIGLQAAWRRLRPRRDDRRVRDLPVVDERRVQPTGEACAS